MNRTDSDRRLKIGVALISLFIVSFLVIQASGAVFTDQTTADGNDITAGTCRSPTIMAQPPCSR